MAAFRPKAISSAMAATTPIAQMAPAPNTVAPRALPIENPKYIVEVLSASATGACEGDARADKPCHLRGKE